MALLAGASADNAVQIARSSLIGGYVLAVRTAAALTIETGTKAVAVQLEALDLPAVAADTPAFIQRSGSASKQRGQHRTLITC